MFTKIFTKLFGIDACKVPSASRFFLPLYASLAPLHAFAESSAALAIDSSSVVDRQLSTDTAGVDFNIKCRLAERTELTDLQGKVLAILGSDTFVVLEDFISNSGWVSFRNYVAQPVAGSTVSVSAGVLRTVADSTFISAPEQGGGSILGLVLAGQEFQILETKEAGMGTDKVRFHRISLQGRLLFPAFKDCQRAALFSF